MKKALALLLSLTMAVGMLTACGTTEDKGTDAPVSNEAETPDENETPSAEGSVYYLNFKPEQHGRHWQKHTQQKQVYLYRL